MNDLSGRSLAYVNPLEDYDWNNAALCMARRGGPVSRYIRVPDDHKPALLASDRKDLPSRVIDPGDFIVAVPVDERFIYVLEPNFQENYTTSVARGPQRSEALGSASLTVPTQG